MRLVRTLLGLLLAARLAVVSASVPETPVFRALGAEHGLPSSVASAMLQDRDGYLWVATDDGLARYDGVGFRTWQHDPADPASLPANAVQAMHLDAQDRLWVASARGGLSMLDVERRRFRHFAAAHDARFALDDVYAITTTPDGALWFGGHAGGLYRYDPARDELQVHRHDPARTDSLASDTVVTLLAASDGTLWVGTDIGLDRHVAGRFEHVDLAGIDAPARTILTMREERDGTLLVGSRQGVLRVTRDARAELQYPWLGPIAVQALVRDRRGTVWIATPGALYQIDGERWQRHVGIGARRGGDAPLLLHLFEDHEGAVWLSTAGAGLQRLGADWRNFAVLTQGEAARGGLANARIHAAAEARHGGLWVVGPTPAIDHVDARGVVTRHQPEGLLRWVTSALDTPDGLWLGSHGALQRFDTRDGSLRRWHGSGPDGVPRLPIDLLVEDGRGQLWVAIGTFGLQLRDAQGRVLRTLRSGDGSGLLPGSIDDMQLAPDGAMWLAGDGGMQRIDRDGRVQAVAGAPAKRVFAFAFDAEGAIWLSTLGALERFRIEDGVLHRVQRIDASHGLPAVETGGMRIDARGDLWIGSRRGLLHWQPASQELFLYGASDGLPTRELATRPPLQTRAGTLAFGSEDGLIWFDPMRLVRERTVPRLALQEATLRRGNATVALDPRQPLQLGHDDRELSISARLLSFADVRTHRYRFRLDGLEHDWTASVDGERTYPRLAPGRYRLEVVAAGADGVWSAPPRTLEIEVASPWWATPRARVGYGLAVVLSLVMAALVYRRVLRARLAAQVARQRHELTRRASEAKTAFLATLGHEIRTPMTGVLGMTELLLRTPLAGRQRDYAESIRRSGEVLLRLVNDALDLARIEAGRLDLADEPVELRALLDDVEALLLPLAERKILILSASLGVDAPRWVRGDSVRLKQILLNLGSNALKFTEHGGVRLQIDADGEGIVFVVSDTGPGLNAEQRARLFQRFSQADGARTTRRYGGSGLGLAICQELTAAMGGRIEVTSEAGRGSAFQVHLPLRACEPAATTEARMPAAVPEPGGSGLSCDVLLVEDDATVAQVVGDLLRLQGHYVAHAAQGLSALTELAQRRFDLAFVDLDLPGIDGLTLAGLIRSHGHDLPLVALTARADPDAEPQARAAGMVAFLRKPVSGEQLAAVVRELTARAGG
jgi:signal transduction histidine kinase/sugar lactone lactonase YvrE